VGAFLYQAAVSHDQSERHKANDFRDYNRLKRKGRGTYWKWRYQHGDRNRSRSSLTGGSLSSLVGRAIMYRTEHLVRPKSDIINTWQTQAKGERSFGV
jgi:hypothetical protein